MAELSEYDWIDIIEDLQDQKAVLLLGPELMQSGGKSLNQQLREHLHQRHPKDIVYYYERDGLFLFQSPESKVRVARTVKRFYKPITPDETLLQRIVQVPFHLIVSLNSDTFLSESFYRHGVTHRFHYFQHRHRDNENAEIEKPTMSLPLIYNLFGSKDQDDSLVLDYDDVYKMLHSAFGTSSLPNKFLRSFREARTYIFLGFHFDKWYSQLLLKFLSEDGRREKLISIQHPLIEKDTYQFMVRQFQVKFIGSQQDFFTQLHEHCKNENLLRGMSDSPQSAGAIAVLKRVAVGELVEALELLRTAAKGSDWENDIVHLTGRFSTLENDKHKMDSRDYRVALAQIMDSIIEFTKQIGE
jgi:Effector-associated domain 11/SIR2-like domain